MREKVSEMNFGESIQGKPAFHKGIFTVRQKGDCFVDMSRWGKGAVSVSYTHLDIKHDCPLVDAKGDWRSAHAILVLGTDDNTPIRHLLIEKCRCV